MLKICGISSILVSLIKCPTIEPLESFSELNVLPSYFRKSGAYTYIERKFNISNSLNPTPNRAER